MRVIFGGTYDPVHLGHLRMANALTEALSVTEVSLMPCYGAVHKQGVGASSQHRVNMLKLAVMDDDSIAMDCRESRRGKDSYTIDSLYELRGELGDESLCFVMGMDAASSISSWHCVNEFSKLTHIVVVNRPGPQEKCLDQAALIEEFLCLGFSLAKSIAELKAASAGKIFFIDLPPLDISSTYIRNRIKQGLSIRYLVTDAVRRYICDNALYQN